MQAPAVTAPPVPPPPMAPPPPSGGRLARWRSSWLLALRMSRREVRRNKGRAALAFVMILFPAVITCLSVSLIASASVNGARKVPFVLGDAQATVDYHDYRLQQAPDPEDGLTQISDDENSVPEESSGDPNEVRAVTGGTVEPFAAGEVRYSVGDLRRRDEIWRYDPKKITGRATLLSGRWPTGPGEAVVTDYGITRGLPTSGTVTADERTADDFGASGDEISLSIVGTASARTLGSIPALIAGRDPQSKNKSVVWFVTGADPVTWDKVVELNKAGYAVTSAAVLTDPPPASVWNPDGDLEGPSRTMLWTVALGAPFMAIVIALLVAPAFAVSAARSRRTLALAASNGANTADLRRAVLGQALIIGMGAAALGALIGVGSVYVFYQVVTRNAGYVSGPGPAIPWGGIAFIVLVAVTSAVVAALVPASRLGRLDIVSVMRGQAASPPPSRVLAGIGLIGVGLSSAVLVMIARGRSLGTVNADLAVSMGSVGIIIGGVLLVPMLLALVARAGRSLPMAGRMAARDMGRHRARSAPTVAAVMAGAAALTLGLTGAFSDAAQQEREYQYSALPGEGYVSIFEPPETGSTERMISAHPELTFTRLRTFDAGQPAVDSTGREAPEPASENRWFTVVPAGCTPAQTVHNPEYVKKLEAFYNADPDKQQPSSATPTDPCAGLGAGGDSERTGRPGVMMMPAEWISDRLDLSSAQASLLRQGGVILLNSDTAQPPPATVQLAWGTYTVTPAKQEGDDDTYDVKVTKEWDAPAIPLTQTARRVGELLGYSMAVASDAPTLASLPTTTGTIDAQFVFERKDGAALSNDDADRLSAELGDTANVGIEHGFQSYTVRLAAGVLGLFAFLLMIVVLTSTALTLSEQQRDQTTLAAVGATAGTRRRMAGTQAFLIAGIGSLTGTVIGLLPGMALARQLTKIEDYTTVGFNGVEIPQSGPVLIIPWLALLAVVILIPLLAGALAAVAVRRAPAITRRPS